VGEKPIQGEQKAFMTGNEAVAWAALAAGAEIMYGYPITPQNEIMQYWTRLAPKYDKKFLQTEDELSAGFTTVGGVLAGRRAFTATAGPGNVLMQEPMSMAEAMRIPTVVVVQQRGGPSTATVIYSQQEVTLTCFGGNGEGLRVVYSTSSHQELFDYTIKAFNTAEELKMINLVNQERQKAGLQPLAMDNRLVYLARLKSQDMIDYDYFDHTSPTYGEPSRMISIAGIPYLCAGENLAGAYRVEIAHNGLMNSPGHRANILHPDFTHIGVGAAHGGPYKRMFTQLFIGVNSNRTN
jgi:uncharacterized YkwD family protein